MPVERAEMNRKLYAALKPGGMLVIADHSAKPGAGTSVGKSLHRIEESALRREVEAAGFKLVAEGDFWRPVPKQISPKRAIGCAVGCAVNAAS
jgi:predicted methyltransferase